MFDRFLAFLKDIPGTQNDSRRNDDDPQIAAAALMYHVMDSDGMRQDVEWERAKAILAKNYQLSGAELERLVKAGEKAENEAVDLYAFTSVLKRHLDQEARAAFIRMLWDVVYADGDLHELEDNTIWRVAELIGVDRQTRIAARQDAAKQAGLATNIGSDD